MNDWKKNLQGSESRDIFKRKHKSINRLCYATDLDLVLVAKHPPGVVAYLDYKKLGDSVTFTEALLYNFFLTMSPVYLVEGDDPEKGPFTIMRYFGGDWRPNPPDIETEIVAVISDWNEFETWELDLRAEYKSRGGWNGNLKGGNDGR